MFWPDGHLQVIQWSKLALSQRTKWLMREGDLHLVLCLRMWETTFLLSICSCS